MARKAAFALSDFDKERILQRNFFKDLEVDGAKIFDAEMTDKEIITFLSFGDSVEGQKLNLKAFQSILSQVEEYEKKIEHHMSRFDKLKGEITSKLFKLPPNDLDGLRDCRSKHGRIDEMWKNYSKIAKAVEDFSLLLSANIALLDAKICKYYRKNFSARLKILRKEKKLTQKSLAQKSGLSAIAIAQYEQCTREPSITTAIKLSKTLGTTIDFLCGV